MRCTACGTEFAVGSFCPNCGTPAHNGPNYQSGMAQTAVRNPEPVRPIQPVLPGKKFSAPAQTKRGSRKTILIIALVLVVALVAGVLSIVQTGPLNTLVSAAKGTLDSGSFTMEMNISDEEYSQDYLMMVEFDPEEEILNLYMETEYTDGGTSVVGIYDGYSFEHYSYGDYEYYYYDDISDGLDDFFAFYQENSEPFDHVFDAFSTSSDRDDLLFILENLDDLTDGELSDLMDLEVLADCLLEYMEQLNDEKWLEEFAGYQGEYIFEPDLYDFLHESLPYFEPAFEDEDVYDELYGGMRDVRNELRDMDWTLEIALESGDEVVFRLDNGYAELEATVFDVGKTELDLDELDSLLEECMDNY